MPVSLVCIYIPTVFYKGEQCAWYSSFLVRMDFIWSYCFELSCFEPFRIQQMTPKMGQGRSSPVCDEQALFRREVRSFLVFREKEKLHPN